MGKRHFTENRIATEVDIDWQKRINRAIRQETEVDPDWFGKENHPKRDETDPGNPSYIELSAFQREAAKLAVLVSSSQTQYFVKQTLSRTGGESAILLCSDKDGKSVVAKLFNEPVDLSKSSARSKILDYMQTEEGKNYTLVVQDTGYAKLGGGNYYFEIVPYCKNGDLTSEGKLSFEELVKLAGYLNEALYSIHQTGILHRDIKPENLYRFDGRVVIGDFGVAKLSRERATRHITGTVGYRAPETLFTATSRDPSFFIDEKCDYYSLGVTLGSLFEGHYIYQHMSGEMVTAAVYTGRLPLTRTDPHREDLENLLRGLCRFDPKTRFGYEDVKSWLADHHYTGGVSDEEWPKIFRTLEGDEFRDEGSLFQWITRDSSHWEEGKKLLYRKYFENFFSSFRTDLSMAARKAEEEWRSQDEDKGLAVFLKYLYPQGPIVWKGESFHGLQEFADRLMSAHSLEAYGGFLKQHGVSHWLEHTKGIPSDSRTIESVKWIETLAEKEPEIACYWFGFSYAKDKMVTICGHKVKDLSGLMDALFSSPKDFYQREDGLKKLLDRRTGADLYGFLYSLGYQSMIETEWEQMDQSDEFHKAVELFSMLDIIAQKGGANPEPIRGFFTEYGPVGIALYTRKLLMKKENPVYVILDEKGRRIVKEIINFQEPEGLSVAGLFQAYIPLFEAIGRMRKILIDNPYHIMAGIYEKEGILCTNLTGCFAFEIWGRMAPLGFRTWIEDD